MSTTTKTVSQKDYLKKYLGKTKKKKKVKSDKINKKNLKLIDDNIDTYQSFEGETLIESGEDAPVVVAIIDERPAQIRLLEHYKNSNRWKPVSNADTKDNESPEIRLINDAVDSKSGNEYVKSDTKHRSKVDSKSEDEYVKSDTKHRSKVDSKSGDEYVKSDTKHRSKVDSNSGDEYVKSDTKHRSKVDSNSGDEYVKSDTKQHSKTNKYKRKHRSKSTSNAKAVLMMTDETLGKNAGTIYRDKKTGKKRDFEAEKLKKIEKRRREDEKKEQYYQWGKGLKQIEDEKTKLKDDLHEMSKPLARYADDDDLDKMLGNQDREGDPLLEYVQNKRMKKEAKEGKITKPKYKGSYAPNRFDIPPSHKWDGVDRSNGFEQKWFEKQSSKKAL